MSRWEKAFLAASVALYAWGAAMEGGLVLSQSRVFVPTGLGALTLVNVRLRSKALAWGVFAAAFVLFMMVFGPFVLGLRATQAADTLKFMRTMSFYLCLSLTALFQLRASRGG